MAELLSATSLLTALLTLLYSVWYPDIRSCMAIAPQRKRADRDAQIRRVEETLYWRGAPLAAGSLVLCLVLLPETVSVLATTARALLASPPQAWPPYDALAATFLVAYLFLLGLAGLAVFQVVRLWHQRQRLRRPDPEVQPLRYPG